MTLFLFLVLLTLALFPNSMTFRVVLILLVSYVLLFFVKSFFIRSLIALVLCIVYFGAVIILVGYVCAVSPNVIFSSTHSIFSFILSFFFIFFSPFAFPSFTPSHFSFPLVNQLLSPFGLDLFLVLVFCLFFVLLMVTTQRFSPKGPFRSV